MPFFIMDHTNLKNMLSIFKQFFQNFVVDHFKDSKYEISSTYYLVEHFCNIEVVKIFHIKNFILKSSYKNNFPISQNMIQGVISLKSYIKPGSIQLNLNLKEFKIQTFEYFIATCYDKRSLTNSKSHWKESFW